MRPSSETETLTDPTLRDTWEIPAELVHAEWPDRKRLDAELETTCEEVSLPKL